MSSGGKSPHSGTSAGALGIPPGFRRTTTRLGQTIGGAIEDPRFTESLSGAFDVFSGLPDSPDVRSALDVFRSDVADPMRLTDPLFLRERERLGAELIERGRQVGGLESGATRELLGTGLGEFTDRYLAQSLARRESAASQLIAQTLGLGQAMFTPFQAITGALGGLIRPGTVQPPSFSNKSGQLLQTAGQLGGALIALA